MIFYFTGTGNSLWVAKALSEALGEQLVSIADELHKEKDGWVYPVRPDEKILFVYPVHSWGPAVSVTRFISRLTLKKSDIANGSILCHYAEQLYLAAWFRCRRQRCGGTETAGCPGTCGRDYRSDPGAWAGRFVSYRKHARFEKLLDLSSFCPSGYRK